MAGQRRVVLLTGASSGIGLATARRFAPSAQLLVVGRDLTRLQPLAAEVGATPICADVMDMAQVKRVAEFVTQAVGRLDVLINCAGQFEVGPVEHVGVETAARLMQVNYLGAVAMIDACLPLLRKGRRATIVNVSSLAGTIAPPYMAAYAASKFALNGYSHALRQELRREGIHVGLVLPGPVDTPLIKGKFGSRYYPRPFGVPVLTAQQVAQAIATVVERQMAELIVPRRLGIARLGAAFPRLVDYVYAGLTAFGAND